MNYTEYSPKQKRSNSKKLNIIYVTDCNGVQDNMPCKTQQFIQNMIAAKHISHSYCSSNPFPTHPFRKANSLPHIANTLEATLTRRGFNKSIKIHQQKEKMFLLQLCAKQNMVNNILSATFINMQREKQHNEVRELTNKIRQSQMNAAQIKIKKISHVNCALQFPKISSEQSLKKPFPLFYEEQYKKKVELHTHNLSPIILPKYNDIDSHEIIRFLRSLKDNSAKEGRRFRFK